MKIHAFEPELLLSCAFKNHTFDISRETTEESWSVIVKNKAGEYAVDGVSDKENSLEFVFREACRGAVIEQPQRWPKKLDKKFATTRLTALIFVWAAVAIKFMIMTLKYVKHALQKGWINNEQRRLGIPEQLKKRTLFRRWPKPMPEMAWAWSGLWPHNGATRVQSMQEGAGQEGGKKES